MADQSNNRGELMDERSGAGDAGRSSNDNGIGRNNGADFSGRGSGGVKDRAFIRGEVEQFDRVDRSGMDERCVAAEPILLRRRLP